MQKFRTGFKNLFIFRLFDFENIIINSKITINQLLFRIVLEIKTINIAQLNSTIFAVYELTV